METNQVSYTQSVFHLLDISYLFDAGSKKSIWIFLRVSQIHRTNLVINV